MSLTEADTQKLTRPFPVEAHEFHRGFCYVAEEEVTARLDEVDPGWTFEIKTMGRGGANNQFGIVSARLTIKGSYRESTGMQSVEFTNMKDAQGKVIGKSEIEAGEAEKAATTDALRRCARLFGIGRYILKMGGDVKDKSQLAAWLKKNYPQQPAKPATPVTVVTQAQPEQQQGEQDKPEPHFSDDDEKRQIIVNTAIKAGYLTPGQGWSDLLRLTDLTDEKVRKFATGNDLGIHVKETCEALKRQLASAQITPAHAARSLAGNHDRIGFVKSPFDTPTTTPDGDGTPAGGSKFARGLDTYKQQQAQQRTAAAHDEIDEAFDRALERNP
jgi:hypothetical protein